MSFGIHNYLGKISYELRTLGLEIHQSICVHSSCKPSAKGSPEGARACSVGVDITAVEGNLVQTSTGCTGIWRLCSAVYIIRVHSGVQQKLSDCCKLISTLLAAGRSLCVMFIHLRYVCDACSLSRRSS